MWAIVDKLHDEVIFGFLIIIGYTSNLLTNMKVICFIAYLNKALILSDWWKWHDVQGEGWGGFKSVRNQAMVEVWTKEAFLVSGLR